LLDWTAGLPISAQAVGLEYGRYSDLVRRDERLQENHGAMLLVTTSGFPNWRRFNDDRKLHNPFEPGSQFAYSGEKEVALLQLIVETVTKETACGSYDQRRSSNRWV